MISLLSGLVCVGFFVGGYVFCYVTRPKIKYSVEQIQKQKQPLAKSQSVNFKHPLSGRLDEDEDVNRGYNKYMRNGLFEPQTPLKEAKRDER